MSNVGRFVWYELLTSEVAGALAFYPEVVGWTPQPWEGGGYTMWTTPQGPLGGVSELPPQAKAMNVPPYWQGNVEVADVDATIAHARQLGGTLHHAEDVPGIGRLAVVGDPQGAVMTFFAPARDMPAHDTARPGELQWHELYTTDEEAAFAFYSALVGWERMGSFPMGDHGNYLLWGRAGKQLGGMMRKPKPDMPSGWIYYITTADLDAAIARATAKGGTVINGPMPVPGGQRIVQLADPQGAVFALVTV